MKKKFIAGILSAVLIIANMAVLATFPDILDTKWSWAKEAVEDMASKNIIKGYEDSTFRPENGISKVEALILMARIAGYNDPTIEPYIAKATEYYSNDLSKYTTIYKGEISYLLYKGVININDLDSYVADTVATTPLLRYEAAILLTKLLGKEGEVLENNNTDLTYTDKDAIPDAAKPYVNYVSINGIMLGMGENSFMPNFEVNRAQMAVLLFRIMPKVDYKYITGVLTSYSKGSNIIKVTVDNIANSYVISSEIPVAVDGMPSYMNDTAIGSIIRITYKDDKIVFIESISPKFDGTEYGIFDSYDSSNNNTVIYLLDVTTKEQKRYKLASICGITLNGKPANINDIKANDFVNVDIKDGLVSVLRAESKSKDFTGGTITNITFDPALKIEITIKDAPIVYEVVSNASVKRNNLTSDITSLLIGDSVDFTLTYNQISDIVATSKTSNVTGKLQAINISANPTIVVTDSSNTTHTFALLRDVVIMRNGVEASVYDLRLSDNVKVTVESDTVTRIELTAADENSSITGKIEYVNTSYGYIKLVGINEIIFLQKAKITDSTGSVKTILDLVEGMNVTAFVVMKTGTYEGSLLVINSK